MASFLFLTREELWTLTQHLGVRTFPGIEFRDLEALDKEAQTRLLDLMERVLVTRGLLGRRRNGTLYVREPALRLLRFGLMPERVYFHGQRLPQGEEQMYFFMRDGAYVVLTQPAIGLVHLMRLAEPRQLLQVVSTALDLVRYTQVPEHLAVRVSPSLLETLFDQVRRQPRAIQEHVALLQTQGVSKEAALALVDTYRRFRGYHGFAQLYPHTEAPNGLAFLQGETWLWRVRRGKQNRLQLQSVTGAQALEDIRELFAL